MENNEINAIAERIAERIADKLMVIVKKQLGVTDESPNAYQEVKVRAEKMVDVFRMIVNAPVPANEREYISWFITAKNIAGGAMSEWEAEMYMNALDAWNGNEQKKGGEADDLGTCKECGTRKATTDYNGHQYYVCDPCSNRLNREFDNEYK
jgi:hypothetical protein